MQAKGDDAIDALADVHFDIPGAGPRPRGMHRPDPTRRHLLHRAERRLQPPGRMWWSVPKGVTEFTTWRELTTVYHEGVPGHHLQVAQTVFRKDVLNKWRRLSAWTSGHGEGWALYAERLMDELRHDRPGNRLGWLDGQSLRAARVVIDIGVHCRFRARRGRRRRVGPGDKAWAYLTAHANMEHKVLRFELDRYLGWPGQAPSYKIGERLWLQLREESAARAGKPSTSRTSTAGPSTSAVSASTRCGRRCSASCEPAASERPAVRELRQPGKRASRKACARGA